MVQLAHWFASGAILGAISGAILLAASLLVPGAQPSAFAQQQTGQPATPATAGSHSAGSPPSSTILDAPLPVVPESSPTPQAAPPPGVAQPAGAITIPDAPVELTPESATLPASDGTAHVETAMLPPPPPSQGVLLDRLVAIVNNDLVLESDVEEEMRFAEFQPNGANTPESALQRLIDRELVSQQEHLQPPAPISDKDLDADVMHLRTTLPACARYACATEAGWQRFLAEHGFTQDEFNRRWRERMYLLRFIEQRFRLGQRISASEVADYYNKTMLPAYAREHVKPPSLEALSARIQEVLLQQRVTQLLDEWLKTLRVQGSVRVLPGWESAS